MPGSHACAPCVCGTASAPSASQHWKAATCMRAAVLVRWRCQIQRGHWWFRVGHREEGTLNRDRDQAPCIKYRPAKARKSRQASTEQHRHTQHSTQNNLGHLSHLWTRSCSLVLLKMCSVLYVSQKTVPSGVPSATFCCTRCSVTSSSIGGVSSGFTACAAAATGCCCL